VIRPSFRPDRLPLGQVLPLDTPLCVILDASEACGFRCGYCFRSTPRGAAWGYAASGAVMGWDVFLKAAAQLMEFPHKVGLVSLSGHGEPLLNPRLAKMARYLRALGIGRVDAHTSAAGLTEPLARELGRAGFTRLVVSLQGLDGEGYARMCGVRVDFERLRRNLALLYACKSPDLAVHIKILDAALPEGGASRFYDLFRGAADSLYVETAVPLWRHQAQAQGTVNKFGRTVGDVACCPLVFYKLLVCPQGGIYPCTQLPPPFSLGDIRETTLARAWAGPKRLEFLRAQLAGGRQGLGDCGDCFVPVNTVVSPQDRVDPFRGNILERMGEAP
jgi:radical SAM protein with 4Fe4S-binding SPASM domain